jgi:hypothetical protein
MCNLYSITTNQAAIIALFRVINRYVGNLAPMPGVFPDHLRWSATPIPAARKSIPIMAKSPKVWVSPEMGMRKMSVEEERLANIEAKATFAAQLAQRTFVRLVKSGAIDTHEAA